METEEQTSTSLTTYMIYAAVSFVLYVLSTGPVFVITIRIDPSRAMYALEIVYYPLSLLARNNVFGELIEWYIGLCSHAGVYLLGSPSP